MPLSVEQVRHVAHLARLAVTDDEVLAYCEQLSEILDYAQMLERLDTDAIPPTASVAPQRGVMRDDVVEPSLPREVALANACHTEEGYFVVNAILEES
jgi:aspartyl-tRNA(Asn)/glutamyl-tRNA(Gln) amidotransferase subunit C